MSVFYNLYHELREKVAHDSELTAIVDAFYNNHVIDKKSIQSEISDLKASASYEKQQRNSDNRLLVTTMLFSHFLCIVLAIAITASSNDKQNVIEPVVGNIGATARATEWAAALKFDVNGMYCVSEESGSKCQINLSDSGNKCKLINLHCTASSCRVVK